MSKLLWIFVVMFIAVIAKAEDKPFDALKPEVLASLQKFSNQWKNEPKKRDDFDSHYFELGRHLRHANLSIGSDYDYESRTGTVDVVGTAGGMRNMFRYTFQDGKVTGVGLVTGMGSDEKVTPIYKDGQELKAGMDFLHRRFLEFCRVALKGEQMHGYIPPLANDKNQSVEKLMKSVTEDWGGIAKATTDENFPKYRDALYKRLKDAGVELGGKTAEELFVPYKFKYFKEGTWAWQKGKDTVDTYVEFKLPFATHRYVFNGKNVGSVGWGHRYETKNYPRRGETIEYPNTDPSCSKNNLKAAVAGLAQGTADAPQRATPASSSDGSD